MRPPLLPRRILRIQSDQDEGRRRRAHLIHHPLWSILLPNNAFWPKNVGATYQQMMQACLRDQIGSNVQVYVDDIVIKTYTANTLLDDLRKTFAALNKYRIKLNPKKCAFGVPAGKLLGYMVSARGIEANPEKVQAVARMQEPTDIKGVQQLTRRLATLSRFIS